MSMILKQIIAKNIYELRVCAGVSSEELAASLSVTEADIGLWESGELTPDVITLKGLADRFGVSVDYFLTRTHRGQAFDASPAKMRHRSHITIALLSFASVWIVALLAFSVILALDVIAIPFWLPFIYAVPLSFTTLVVFNSLWGELKFNIIFSSLILWGLVSSVYLTLLFTFGINVWSVFVVGIPLQIALCFIPCTGVVRYTFFSKRGI